MECANEVIRYLGQSQGFTDDIKSRVVRHLASCIQLSSKGSFIKPMQPNPPSANTSAMATGIQTTNAQLGNGQVVQVVKSQFQNTKAGQYTQPITIAPAVSSLPVSNVPTQIPVAIASDTVNMASSSEPTHYITCTQPLHIQIPPVLSPVIIQTKPTQQQKQLQAPVVHKVQDAAPQASSHLYNIQQETLVTSTSPSPQLRDMSIPSPSLKASQKSHTYFSLDDPYADFVPRTRTYSFTSSASSESELNSPLNLSQSPQYYERKDSIDSSFSTPLDNHHIEMSDRNSSQYFVKNSLSSSKYPTSNFTSVIVDGRKTADGHIFNKYMHIMDEDRLCIRSDGFTSPVSSACEERLWRPW